MRQRVRALLTAPDGRIVTYRRIRPDRPVYWILPGGHVEPTDDSLTAALHREIREELGGEATIERLVHITREADDHFQYIYFGHIETWSLDTRTGDEFSDPANGEYHLDLIAPNANAVAALNLKPEDFAERLAWHLAGGEGLDKLPTFDRPADVPLRVVR